MQEDQTSAYRLSKVRFMYRYLAVCLELSSMSLKIKYIDACNRQREYLRVDAFASWGKADRNLLPLCPCLGLFSKYAIFRRCSKDQRFPSELAFSS